MTLFIGTQISFPEYQHVTGHSNTCSYVDIVQFMKHCPRIETDKIDFGLLTNLLSSATGSQMIWYHLGSFEETEIQFVQTDSEFGFSRRQFSSFLTFLEIWISENCLLIDDPKRQRLWSNKLYQQYRFGTQQVANLIPGFFSSTPQMLEIGTIIKHIGESRRVSADADFFPLKVDPEIIRKFAESESVPFICQTRILSPMEYRTYFFSNSAIHIQFERSRDSVAIDIHEDVAALSTASAFLPSSTTLDQIESIRKIVGLNVFSLDYFIVEDTVLVLEINPLTSWAWLPPPLRTLVGQAVLKMLQCYKGIERK